ncbi:LysR family transcriptional regulator [Thiolapillus brandeum]|uniref:LysR family transcriptional regulator n=1 Tax=Thiolapillus brandeum TaxID=1076588 RepID=A0A7U6GIH9_9GAMM|nr:LysR family transcriptional regulator [Thiolapillus brandeum]BAO44276.1 LysR family transcriptional regulator [Thiolapillus brandeum]
MMDLNNLRAFLAVAETGSFSQAAKRLHLTQPAVSKRIALLEDELGLLLFDRIGRHSRLTHAGGVLLPRARELILKAQDLKNQATSLTQKVSGPLTLGTSHHIGLHRLPDVLRHYRKDFPDVQLDIHFMDSEEACRAVDKGELEMAIVTLPSETPPNLRTRKLWRDELCFVTAPVHELAGRKRVSLKQLTQYPAVLPGPTTFTRAILEKALLKHGLTISLGMSTNYMETLKMLTEINLGWSLLPRIMLTRAKLKILPVKLQLTRSLGLVTHKERILSNPAKAMVSCLP